jgi:predicted DNA-binding protein with PD1-like motif
MKGCEISIGRTFMLTMEDGDDFFASLKSFCEIHKIKQGYIPGFIAGFRKAKLVGTIEAVDDKNAPVWSHVYLETVEALGCGTIAATESGEFSPHVHVSVGRKTQGASAYTSHLLEAEVIFLAELTLIEITAPELVRVINKTLYGVPLLSISGSDI